MEDKVSFQTVFYSISDFQQFNTKSIIRMQCYKQPIRHSVLYDPLSITSQDGFELLSAIEFINGKLYFGLNFYWNELRWLILLLVFFSPYHAYLSLF